MQKQNEMTAIYNVRELGAGKTLVLGAQHTFAMFGATVLVPLLTGLNVSTTLLCAGLGTLLFHFITGGKVPAFLGSSFAFLGGFGIVAPMLADESGNLTVPNTEMLPYACGGVVAAGLLYLVMSGLITAFGVRRIMRFFPPVVTGPIIIAIGLILAPSAINNCSSDWVLALIALGTVVVCNIWGKGMVKILPILIGVVVSYVAALIMGRVDFAAIASADWFGIPLSTSAMAKFDISAILTIMPIALATMMEHIGDIAAISATTGKNYIRDPGLNRTLLGDGLATSLAGFLGGPMSFCPKLGAAINTIPAAIVGGISFILYGMISAIGVRNVVENKVDFTNSRNLIIAAVILVSALGFNSAYPNGLPLYQSAELTISLSGLAIAAILGIVLNAVLPGNDYEFDNTEKGEQGLNMKV